MKKVFIQVPATSANCGPGFDTLGLACNLYNEVSYEITDKKGFQLEVEGEGADYLKPFGRNLAFASFLRVWNAVTDGQRIGLKVKMLNRNTYEIDTRHLVTTNVPDDLSRQMRASYYFLGALLSRFGKAQVAMPGGCNLGPRPIDQHLKVFSALGAEDSVDYGMITVHAEELNGAHIFFDKVSVGATMNGMLSAVMAKGQTILENCAKEPHVVDLANFLNMCGADVRGAGTDVIKVRGVEKMHGCTYSIIPDQIEAGSYMVAAAATGGDVLIKNVTPKHLEPITACLLYTSDAADE